VHLSFLGLEIEMQNFDLTNAVQWCHLLKMPEKRSKKLEEMNDREIAGLSIQGAAIAVLSFERRSEISPDTFLKESVEFACIDSFWNYAKKLMKRNDVKELVFKCRKLRKTKLPSIINIYDIDKVPLDTQLTQYTGDGFNISCFNNEDDINSLCSTGVIVHKKTGTRFFIPDGNV
jgi:hypothetical protein